LRRSGRDPAGGGKALRVVGALLSLQLLGYVLPADRVLLQVAAARRGAPPIQLTVSVGESEGEAEFHAWVDLHPRGGWRIVDERGNRWIGQGPWGHRGPGVEPPVGLAEAWLLGVSDEDRLPALVAQLGVDLGRNQLARCGEAECFVLGGRNGEVQLWIQKDRFEVRRLLGRGRDVVEFESYREQVGRLRIPSQIRVTAPSGTETLVRVVGVERAPSLENDPELTSARLGGAGGGCWPDGHRVASVWGDSVELHKSGG
jgi:hypothetical protein